MDFLTRFHSGIEEELRKIGAAGHPPELYEPIRYMLALGGKRLRPALMLMSYELFGNDPSDMMRPAAGLEVFHNFTLLHDDIMDKAPLRRKKETVHSKWNADIAILSGDAMFVKACMLMSEVPDKYLRAVLDNFYRTAIQVCEGQQIDMNFERREMVTKDEYINMITLKTAVLLGCALSIGAICAGAPKQDEEALNAFGVNLGIAFQLHDDILDLYGDEEKFGKRVGGDIHAGKKTILLISAHESADAHIRDELFNVLKTSAPEEKIARVKDIFASLGVREMSEALMNEFFQKALAALDKVNVPAEKKADLLSMADALMVRER